MGERAGGLRERKVAESVVSSGSIPSVDGKVVSETKYYSWDEIAKHCKKKDSWIVVDGKVYDISSWAFRHPGGIDVISSYAGQDASEPFQAFHPDQYGVRKYLPTMYIGEVLQEQNNHDEKSLHPHHNTALLKDFRTLRDEVKKQGLYKVNAWFYVGMLAHIFMLEALSWCIMSYFGPSWPIIFLCGIIMATAQAQSGWLQHDFGHLSVFKSSKWNHWMHTFVICHLKAASRTWWNWYLSINFKYFFLLRSIKLNSNSST